MSAWLPIATAPKDGSPILSWDGAQAAVIAWCGCKQRWHLLEGGNRPDAECSLEWESVTHWMPVPVPPLIPAGAGSPDGAAARQSPAAAGRELPSTSEGN